MSNKNYRITHATNPFTRYTGKLAMQMLGGSNCLLVKSPLHNGIPVQRLAYCLHNKIIQFKGNIKIKTSTTCNASNCINIDHITAVYKPNKDDVQYMNDWIKSNGVNHQAHIMKIPPQLLQDYLDTHIDII